MQRVPSFNAPLPLHGEENKYFAVVYNSPVGAIIIKYDYKGKYHTFNVVSNANIDIK